MGPIEEVVGMYEFGMGLARKPTPGSRGYPFQPKPFHSRVELRTFYSYSILSQQSTFVRHLCFSTRLVDSCLPTIPYWSYITTPILAINPCCVENINPKHARICIGARKTRGIAILFSTRTYLKRHAYCWRVYHIHFMLRLQLSRPYRCGIFHG